MNIAPRILGGKEFMDINMGEKTKSREQYMILPCFKNSSSMPLLGLYVCDIAQAKKHTNGFNHLKMLVSYFDKMVTEKSS